jgi:hypothetical protein
MKKFLWPDRYSSLAAMVPMRNSSSLRGPKRVGTPQNRNLYLIWALPVSGYHGQDHAIYAKEYPMDSELVERSKQIRQRITQLRDSL